MVGVFGGVVGCVGGAADAGVGGRAFAALPAGLGDGAEADGSGSSDALAGALASGATSGAGAAEPRTSETVGGDAFADVAPAFADSAEATTSPPCVER